MPTVGRCFSGSLLSTLDFFGSGSAGLGLCYRNRLSQLQVILGRFGVECVAGFYGDANSWSRQRFQ